MTTCELRDGRWEDVLADIECDAVITDPPYSDVTHAGAAADRFDGHESNEISYQAWAPDDVRRFVEHWHEHCRGWIVALTDTELIPAWRAEYRRVGRYAFAPVPCVITGMTVRLVGDGPSSWAVYAMVSRPSTKEYATWGTLPGAYVVPRAHTQEEGRGKPPWLMSALVRDYSRPGDLVVDPCAGYGSTLVAAVENGRDAIGAEVDAEVHAVAVRKLGRPIQRDLFAAGGAS